MSSLNVIDPSYLLLLALAAPLLAFLISGVSYLSGYRLRQGWLATAAIALSFVAALLVFMRVWNEEALEYSRTWFVIGKQTFEVGLLANNLSVLLLLLVTAIALPVHVYSMAYMKGDEGIHRYWMYLSLFCFSMLGLVLANNLLMLYIGWELVGFSSYLLIGYWYKRPAAGAASKKAFLLNRVGDLGFLIGIACVYSSFGTLSLSGLFSEDPVASADFPLATVAGIAFFIGAMAKSAQFPLHAWLPDAMEGPTAVSSLIHAATMVAAGVFLLARIHPLFNDAVLSLICMIGVVTAVMAAGVALTQQDIKKVLAFSTVSQLGFMMVAIGIGQYGAAIFHLVTHAFFKCLLFLSAGAVIHELQHVKASEGLDVDPQDMRNMGGLREKMPFTFIVCLIASLALVGLPLTAGYLSKDALLIYAFEWSEWQNPFWKVVPAGLLLASGLTAFYIGRFFFKVFFGPVRLEEQLGRTLPLHDAPAAMRYPMFVLAIGCCFPLFAINPLLFEDAWLLHGFAVAEGLQRINIYHTVVPAAINSLSIVMLYLAWRWYARGAYPLKSEGLFYRLSFRQGYINELYEGLIVRPVLSLARVVAWFDRKVLDGLVNFFGILTRRLAVLSAWVEHYLVDGAVNAAGKVSVALGGLLRGSKSGKIQHYLFTMLLLVFLFLLFSIYSQL